LLIAEIQSILLPQLVNLLKHVLGERSNELNIGRQEIAETPSGVWNAAVAGKIVMRYGKVALGKKLPHGSLSLRFRTLLKRTGELGNAAPLPKTDCNLL